GGARLPSNARSHWLSFQDRHPCRRPDPFAAPFRVDPDKIEAVRGLSTRRIAPVPFEDDRPWPRLHLRETTHPPSSGVVDARAYKCLRRKVRPDPDRRREIGRIRIGEDAIER